MINADCINSDRIVDVECCFKDGLFYLGRLPSCLPALFTVRFTAPRDYAAGDAIVVGKVEMPVLTSQMEAAGEGIFKAGAIILCEIDLDRSMAFVRTSNAGCACEEVEFQKSNLVYYIDPNGDDSPNNPGGTDSPFKTLAAAGRAAWQNIVMNPLGKLIFSFNPGTYEFSNADQMVMLDSVHPQLIIYRATDSANKPLLRSDTFSSGVGKREFQNLRLHALTDIHQHALSPAEYGMTTVRDVELILSKSNTFVIAPYVGGALGIHGSLKIDGNDHTPLMVFYSNLSYLWAYNALITIENMPSVVNATAWSESGNIYFSNCTITGNLTGKRYHAMANGTINTLTGGNQNFFPGTTAGTTASGGQYL